MESSFSKKYLRVIAFLLILTTYLPLVYKNIPGIPGSHHLYAAIWLGSILVFYPRLLGQRLVMYFLFYGIFFIGLVLNTLWVGMTDWNKLALVNEFYVFSVAISIIFYFLMVKDYEGLAWLVKWSLIFIGITAIMSIYAASVNPMYARLMTAGELDDLEYFQKLGAGGYGFASSLIALFPMMIYFYRNKGDSIFSKIIIIVFGILIFITLIELQFFTNIILACIVIFISILGRKVISQSLVIISFFLIIFYAIPTTIYADLLVTISSFFDPESNIYFKLKDTADLILYGDRYASATEDRAARYPMLLEVFIEYPIFGASVSEEGKNVMAGVHLYWMNKLAILGLFGFIPLVFIHITYIKSIIKLFNKEFTFYFLISVFTVIGLGLIKALAGRELWFTYFILLPGIYFLPLLKKKNNTH